MRDTMKRIIIIVIITISFSMFLAPDSTNATTITMTSFEQVAQGSKLIFDGKVLSKETRLSPINDMPFTYFTFEIIDVIKGNYLDQIIELGFMGGRKGSFTLGVSDLRMPEIGERGIYFVENPSEQQANPLFGWHQGHYLVITDNDNSLELVIPKGQELLESNTLELNLVPSVENFKQKVRRILEGSYEFEESQEPLFRRESSPYSLFGTSWPNAEATVYSTGGSSNSTFDNAFVEAMNNWNNLSDFSFSNVSGFADPCADPDSYGPPWLTGYAFRDDICGSSFGSSILAVNRYWSNSSGEIIQAGTIFNTVWSWDVHSGSGSSSDFKNDFKRVATHELGHALGLGHDNTYSAIMNPIYSHTIETPQTDDINGIRAIYGGTGTNRADVEAFVTRFYQQCLLREPESGGLNYYTDHLINGTRSGSDVAGNFINSPEFLTRNTSNEDYLLVMYRAFFDREPDNDGWNYYMIKLNNGESRDTVFNGFVYSPEFETLCNNYGISPYSA